MINLSHSHIEFRKIHLQERRILDGHLSVKIHIGGSKLPFGWIGKLRQIPLNGGNISDVHLAIFIYVAEGKINRLFGNNLRCDQPFAAALTAHAVGRAFLGVGRGYGRHDLILMLQSGNDLLRHYHLAAH